MNSTAKVHISMDSIMLQRRIVGLLQTAESEHDMAAFNEDGFYRGRVAAFFHALEMLSGLDLERPK